MISKGFTLVELLIVIAVAGILAYLVIGNFTSSQLRGRDTQRKSDLRQIASALEIFYSDYGKYPDSSNGQLLACPYAILPATPLPCDWTQSARFTDSKTDYFVTMPKDPSTSRSYYYRVPDSANQKFQLYANLEYKSDKSCLYGNCVSPSPLPVGVDCGMGNPVVCNFAITSARTTPSE